MVGILLEKRIAFGHVILRIISTKSGKEIAERIRRTGHAVTAFQGEGLSGPVTMLYVVCLRKEQSEVVRAKISDKILRGQQCSVSLTECEALKRRSSELDSSQGCDLPVAGEETGSVRKDDFHFVTGSTYHDPHAKGLVVDHIVILK